MTFIVPPYFAVPVLVGAGGAVTSGTVVVAGGGAAEVEVGGAEVAAGAVVLGLLQPVMMKAQMSKITSGRDQNLFMLFSFYLFIFFRDNVLHGRL